MKILKYNLDKHPTLILSIIISIMLFIAVLFNPINPIHFKKIIWVIFDIIVGILFLISIVFIKEKNKKGEEKEL